MRRLLVLLVLATTASAEFPVAEPEYAPGAVQAIGGDDQQFYVFRGSFLTRHGRDGTIVDTDGIWLPGVYNQSSSAASGAGMVVLTAGADSYGQLAAVDAEGRLLWTYTAQHRALFNVVFDGDAFVALWSEGNPRRMGLLRVDAKGQVLEDRELLASAQGIYAIRAAAVDGGVLIVLQDGRAVRALFAAPDQPVLQIVIADTAARGDFDLSVASNGNEALVMWTSTQAGSIEAVALDASLRTRSRPASFASHAGRVHAVAWDGAVFRLAWESADHRSVETMSVDAALHVVHPVTSIFAGDDDHFLRIAPGAGGVMFVRGRYGIFAARGEAVASPPRLLRTERLGTAYPFVVWTGSRYAVVWKGGRNQIRARYFDRDGAALASSFAVTGPDPTMVAIGLAATNDTLLVLMGKTDTIMAMRFDLDGNPVDAAPFEIAGRSVAVASDGRDFMIAASEGCTIRLHALGGRAPFAAGQAVELQQCDLSVRQSPALFGIYALRLVWDGSSYGLVYHETYASQCFCTGVDDALPWLLRVTPSLATTRAIPLVDPTLRRVATAYLVTGLVAAQGKYFLTWSAGGAFVPFDLSSVARMDTGRGSAVGWTGSSYLVLIPGYLNYRFLDAEGNVLATRPRGDIYAAATDGSGGSMIVYNVYPRAFLFGDIVTGPTPKRRSARN